MTTNNISKTSWIQKPLVAACLLLLMIAGCASSSSIRPLQPGDGADIHFLCRLRTGEIVAATEDKAVEKNQLKAGIYLVRDKSDPISVIIPVPPEKPPSEKEETFEDDIVARLTGNITGLKEGEMRHVEVAAEDIPERNKEDYVIRLARVRERPKEFKMSIGEYQSRTGKPPEIGQAIVFDPAIPGRVDAVNGQDVVIRFAAKEGDIVQTPYGSGRIREEDNVYKIDIDARKGSLVRTGHLVGRITDVDNKFMIVDYRNPFGGETLACDVTIDKITEAEGKKDGAEEK